MIGFVQMAKGEKMSRYIDEDSLRKEYNDWYKLFSWGDGTDAEKATIARAIQILDEQPTTDAKEAVRGKWIKHENNPRFVDCLECPFCNCWFVHEHLVRNSFCPNCGADMRGEK